LGAAYPRPQEHVQFQGITSWFYDNYLRAPERRAVIDGRTTVLEEENSKRLTAGLWTTERLDGVIAGRVSIRRFRSPFPLALSTRSFHSPE